MSAVVVPPAAADDVVAEVAERESRRLLQLPRGGPLSVELQARAREARRWYASHGRPFTAMRRVALRAIEHDAVRLDPGTVLTSEALAAGLRAGGAHAVVVVAASAGPEVAEEAARRWAADRPDEAYFLDRLAAAVAERLLPRAASGLRDDLARCGERLLPHQSPGCGRLDLADQRCLMALLAGEGHRSRPASCGPVTLLESGALSPQHSVLAVFGVTRRSTVETTDAPACRSCDLEPCEFRRAPFKCHSHRPRVAP